MTTRRKLRGVFAAAAAALSVFGAPRALAQCSVTAQPSGFEPNPPGLTRPIALLSPGFNSNLALYQNGAGGPWRILMQESFGYSTLDITNRTQPSVLKYDYLPFASPNPVTRNGDGQSYISTLAASPDGQRVSLATNGPADPPWHTIIGVPDTTATGFNFVGDAAPVRASATVMQQAGARYIHYGVDASTGVYASDVTSLGATLASLNVAYEKTSWQPGVSPTLATSGSTAYLVYPTSTGGIQIVDVSNPGPAGSITASMPQTNLTASSLGQASRSISYVKAAVDPSNSQKLWLLVEFYAAAGTSAPSYGLYYVTESANQFSNPTSAGTLFDVPAQAGETWSVTGSSSAVLATNGTVQVLMWASRRLPSSKITLYATTAGSWGTWNANNPQATDITTSGFGLNGAMGILQDAGTTVYAYISASANAYVMAMSCQAADAPATSSFVVKNASKGNAVVNDGDTLPYGEQLTVTPTILPTPVFGQSSDLISWGWHVDYDFHQGAVAEDLGAGLIPRLANPDNNVLGSPTYPPASFTLVGPCDPKNSGTPSTGAGCWTSVTTNTSQGGPDFTGTETPVTPKPTRLALEAINVKGSNGAKLFTINWKVPTLSLQSSLILAGSPLTAVTDGHPQGNFKWYFGAAPTSLVLAAGCTTASCTPTGADASQGLHYYFYQAPFSQIGYATPDYSSSALGTYTVTNFAPAFTVNGASSGTVTIGPAQAMTIVNSSQRGTGTTGAYFYSLVPQGNPVPGWLPIPGMTDTSGPATLANPGVGSYTLRLKVDYTSPSGNGTVYWPDPSGVGGITVVATNSLTVTAFASPQNANSGDTVQFNCQVTGGSGNYSYIWSGQFGTVATTAAFTQRFTNSTSSNATYLFDCSATDTLTGATGDGNVTVTVAPGAPTGPPTAQASVSPLSVAPGTPATFSCSAFGGTPPYSYQWTNGPFAVATSQTYVFTPSSAGTVSLTCTVTDAQNKTGVSTAVLSVIQPGPACNAVDFDVYLNGVKLVPQSSPFGSTLPMQAAVGDKLYFSIKGTPSSQYDWDWGDTTPHLTGPISDGSITFASHTYLSPATYTVTLRGMYVDNSAFCGGTSYQIQITGIQVNPNFTPGYADATTFVTTNVTGGKAVRFEAAEANADTYAWDFGDGYTGAGKVVVHTFAAGAPTVRLTVTKGATVVSSTLALTVVAPPDPPRWALPGMAYVTGAGGTFWTSDVSFFNPDATYSQNLKVAFLDGAHAVSDESQLTYVALNPIAPLAGINVKNALAALGRPVGSYGALIVKGEAGQPAIAPVFTTRTYNDQTAQGAGTFGLSVPSAAASGGGVTAQAAVAANLLVGLRQNAAARTNLFLVNLNNEWPTVRLDFADAAGKALGTKIVSMNPYQSTQINNAVQEFAETADLFSVKVSIVDQSGGAKSYAVYPYATVIDQGSTDPIVVAPTSAPASSYRIPGIVRLTGANGEKWRSRVTLSNPSALARRVRLTYSFVRCDAAGCSDRLSYNATVNMAPGQTQSWDDWVKVWFQLKYFALLDETATYKDSLLDVAADDAVSDPLVVLGETYNDAAAGHIGLQVPGYGVGDGASRTGASTKANKRLVLPGLRFEGDAAAGTGFRTNVAVFLTSGTSGGWCSAHVYGPDGTKIKDTAIPVTPFAQLSSAGLGVPADFGPFNVVLDNFDDGITVAAYATIVDNKSGDSTFVKATPVP